MAGKDFESTNMGGLTSAREKFPDIPESAIDGDLMDWAPSDRGPFVTIGAWWLILDETDPRVGHLHSILVNDDKDSAPYLAKAHDIERYMANLLVATRRLDVVHLLRQGCVNDYREKGRAHDAKLASVLAEIRARGAS